MVGTVKCLSGGSVVRQTYFCQPAVILKFSTKQKYKLKILVPTCGLPLQLTTFEI